MSIVTRVQEIAEKKHTTIKAIERAIGIANGSIRRWDESSPSCEKAKKVAEHLDISLEWLITGKTGDYTAEEQEIINAYRRQDEGTRRAVCKILDVEREEPEKSSTSRTG